MAANAPEYLKDWAIKINKLIADNIEMFIDDDYLETVGDREVARKIEAGYKIEDL